jgi:hypothetical protein
MRPHPNALVSLIQQNLLHLRAALMEVDSEKLARQSHFLHRAPRKIPIPQFVLALVSLAAETVLSLERIAAVVSLAAQTTYSKQALHQRLSSNLEQFLAQVATALFGSLVAPVKKQGWLTAFERVLLHDSTIEPLPAALAQTFPGPANGRHRGLASLKLQFVCDLIQSQVLHLSLSGFTRNDQRASPDILPLLRKGDLLIRDLGYFVLPVLKQITATGACFLSRYRHGVLLFDVSGQPIDLARRLRPGQHWDGQVLLGQEKLPVRLVAQPVPEGVANERRRKARINRDRRLHPGNKRLYLLGWNIFVTNVPQAIWPAQAFQPIYRLRWRMEIIFKAWKSHWGLRQLNCRTVELLRLSVMTKLLFCIAVYRLCNAMELQGGHQRHWSLLRLARILGNCSCWFAATVLGVSLPQWIRWHLHHHAFYEIRKDRKNFYELFTEKTYA